MKTAYIVSYWFGDTFDYYEFDIFVTEDKELAERYVVKFNNLLARLKEHYKRYENEDEWIKEEYDEIKFQGWQRVMECSNCNIKEVEIR